MNVALRHPATLDAFLAWIGCLHTGETTIPLPAVGLDLPPLAPRFDGLDLASPADD